MILQSSSEVRGKLKDLHAVRQRRSSRPTIGGVRRSSAPHRGTPPLPLAKAETCCPIDADTAAAFVEADCTGELLAIDAAQTNGGIAGAAEIAGGAP